MFDDGVDSTGIINRHNKQDGESYGDSYVFRDVDAEKPAFEKVFEQNDKKCKDNKRNYHY